MFKEMIDTGDALKMSGVTTNINERVNYTANSGTAFISTANTSLTGGTTVALLTTAVTTGSVGTLIKQFTIKGRGSVSRGMIRLFLGNGDTLFNYLIDEIDVDAVVQVDSQNTFEITFDVDWSLGTGLFISAATNNAEGFCVSMEALDLTYP